MEVRNCWYHWVNVVHRTEDLRGFERSQSFSADDHRPCPLGGQRLT